jgi:hypothetical protein
VSVCISLDLGSSSRGSLSCIKERESFVATTIQFFQQLPSSRCNNGIPQRHVLFVSYFRLVSLSTESPVNSACSRVRYHCPFQIYQRQVVPSYVPQCFCQFSCRTIVNHDDGYAMDDEALTAAEEGRYSLQPPKVNLCGSPKLYWQAFQAMRQVGESETRVLSQAEVEQLCSPRLS